MKAYKGFNKDLTCRGFQFEIGKEYEEDSAKLCDKGFHACEYPLDCFSYYPPNKSRYCEVELEDNGERESGNTKVCGEKIKIGAEIGIKGLIEAAFEYTKEQCTNSEMGADNSALTGGDSSTLTGGNRSALTGGDWSALTGGYSSALTGGNCSALTGGNRSALTGGYSSALTGGNSSALIGGNCSALTGGYSSVLTGGDYSALTGAYYSALTGGTCSVVYGGENAKVRGGLRSVLAIQYWVDYEFKGIKFAEVDGEIIKANVFYKLNEKGEFIEDDSTTSKTDK